MEVRPVVSRILESVEKVGDVVLNRGYWLENTVMVEKRGDGKYSLYSRDGLVLHVELNGDKPVVILKMMGEW